MRAARQAEVGSDLDVAVPLLLAAVATHAAFGGGGVHRWLLTEDGVVEWAQFAAYAAAAWWLAVTARRRRAVGSPWAALAVMAAGFVFVAGEEVAWGQRLLDLRVDTLQDANRQGELTLHNLGDNLQLSWLAFCALAVFGAAAGPATRLLPPAAGRLLGSVAPPSRLRWWFLPAAAYAALRLTALDAPSYEVAKASEYLELAVAVGFAVGAREASRVSVDGSSAADLHAVDRGVAH